MKIVVFGLTVSSSWGNGHATLWRGLCKALQRKGCRVVFFERDVPYYADARDMHELLGGFLVLYPDWESIETRARREVGDADVTIVTSFCPDGIAAAELAALSGAAASGTPLSHCRRAVSAGFPMVPQHLFCPPPAARRARGIFLILSAGAQPDTFGHGAHGLVPVRPAVRSHRMRRPGVDRRMGRARHLLHAE